MDVWWRRLRSLSSPSLSSPSLSRCSTMSWLPDQPANHFSFSDGHPVPKSAGGRRSHPILTSAAGMASKKGFSVADSLYGVPPPPPRKPAPPLPKAPIALDDNAEDDAQFAASHFTFNDEGVAMSKAAGGRRKYEAASSSRSDELAYGQYGWTSGAPKPQRRPPSANALTLLEEPKYHVHHGDIAVPHFGGRRAPPPAAVATQIGGMLKDVVRDAKPQPPVIGANGGGQRAVAGGLGSVPLRPPSAAVGAVPSLLEMPNKNQPHMQNGEGPTLLEGSERGLKGHGMFRGARGEGSQDFDPMGRLG